MTLDEAKEKLLLGPPFQRPFTTKTEFDKYLERCSDLHFRGLSQLEVVIDGKQYSCSDLHFRGLSQPIDFIFPSSPFVYWGFMAIGHHKKRNNFIKSCLKNHSQNQKLSHFDGVFLISLQHIPYATLQIM